MKTFALAVLVVATAAAVPAVAQTIPPDTFSGLRARSIGPAVTSGRVMTIAVDPTNNAVVLRRRGIRRCLEDGERRRVVSAGVRQGRLVLDRLDRPRSKRPSIVWVGTGERNSQRSVAYGDGVYKSEDSGRSWTNVGLKSSEHIGRVVIDPRKATPSTSRRRGRCGRPAATVGSTRRPTAARRGTGVEDLRETGVSDVVSIRAIRTSSSRVVPTPPAFLHADRRRPGERDPSQHRRRQDLEKGHGRPAGRTARPDRHRHLAGATPTSSTRTSRRRTARAASSVRSTTASPGRSATDYNARRDVLRRHLSPIRSVDRVYIPDVIFQVSDDGGKTMHSLGQRYMHVDNHVIWVDPTNTDHMMVGNDGGLYRSFDRARDLDVLQQPAAPAVLRRRRRQRGAVLQRLRRRCRTTTRSAGRRARDREHGILNQDWFVTQGGDGFVSRVDPEDPNTIYAELQHGVIDALRQAHRRAHRHPAAGREGRRAGALELGLPVHHLAAFAHAPVFRRAGRSTDPTIAATAGRPCRRI